MAVVVKSPSMPLYGKDAYDDEQFKKLSFGAQGLFWRLVWWQWIEGSIPDSIDEILDGLPRRQSAEARRLWPAIETMFEQVDGRRKNARIEEHRTVMLERREKNARGAIKTNRKLGRGTLSDTLSDTDSESQSDTLSVTHSDSDTDTLRARGDTLRAATATAIAEQVRSPDGVQGKGRPPGDFSEAWAAYPRKRGRTEAERHFRAQVKTPADYGALLSAIGNYRRELEILGTDEAHTAYGSTFFNGKWREFVDGEWSPPAPPRPNGAQRPHSAPHATSAISPEVQEIMRRENERAKGPKP